MQANIVTLFLVCVTAAVLIMHIVYRHKVRAFISRIKEEELRLINVEKMASLGTLSAGIAHEINNPLTFVTTNLTIMQKYPQMDTIDRVEMAQMLEECMEGAVRIKRIVQDLLSFSHPSQGKKVYSSVSGLIDATLRILWNEIKYKTDIVKEYHSQSCVWLDPSQVSQVFLNLIMNAVQSIREKGTITLVTDEDKQWIYVRITDTGCGMDAKIKAQVFEPFYTTKNGTGLGLFVSKNIIEKHKGRISVESVLGQGTTFTIALPKESEPAA